MNLFLTSALHQFQQVKSAIEYFHLNADDTQILYFSFDHQEIPSQLLPSCINCVRFTNWVFKDLLNATSSAYRYLGFLKKIRGSEELIIYTSQYFSDTTLLTISILKPKNVIILDEGTASFRIADYRAKHSFRLNPKLLLKSILYKTFLLYPKNVTYYTQYNFKTKKNDNVIKYEFSKRELTINIEKGFIIVLGSSISEVGVVSQQSYLKLLKQIRMRHKGYRIDYYPHRKETSRSIYKVEALGYNIHNSNIPFESAYACLGTYPEIMYSFISPVFDNISKQYSMFPNLYIVEIPKNMYLDSNTLKTYEQIYSNYRMNKDLKVVTI